MATRAVRRAALAGEPRFFTAIAAAQMAVVLVGFGMNIGLGRADVAALPWTLHLHALAFLGWSVLAIAQPVLIGRGRWSLHRTLGWVGVALAAALVLSGVAVTIGGIRAGRLEPASLWMAMNLLTVASFTALVVPAVVMRRATDWHRRLLTCATILMTGPAWARILPMEWFGPFGLLVITVAIWAFVVWGMMYDRNARGRIHPAWWWGGAGVGATGILSLPLAMLPPFAAWAETFAAT